MKKIISVTLAIVMTALLFACPLQATAAMSADAISWYRSKLNNLHDYYYAGTYTPPLDEAQSKFALIDIDGDHVDELIVRLHNGIMASTAGRIYCYDKAKSSISECEIGHYVSAVYQNGYIKVDASHNHSPGDTIWPYSVYRYDAATKEAKFIFSACCADAGHEGYGAEYYSYYDDADHDGVIYYINSFDTPLTKAQYDAYVNRYIPKANKRNLVWYKMTKSNISKLSNQMLSQEYRLSAPKITKFENVNSGIKLTWNSTGAAKYAVFYRLDGYSWKKIGTTSGTSFTHKNLVSGKKYTYTVRCISADGSAFTSAYNTTGWSYKFIAPPNAPTLTRTSSGIRIKWNKPKGAVKFRVFRKTGSGKWQRIGDTTSTQWTNKSVKRGKKYTYTIRCISADGTKYHSGYHTKGTSIVF